MKKAGLFLIVILLCLPLTGISYVTPEFTSNPTLPDAMQGMYYSAKIKAKGSGPLTFSFEPGDYTAHSVPKGLTMNKEGLIYGTPQKPGSYQFVVQVSDATIPAQTTDIFYLTVKSFDESSLKQGGSDTGIIGYGLDDLTGVANAPNGGRAAMGKGLLFFVNSKGYLMQSSSPFRNASRSYGAAGYDCLDTLSSDLYYFQRYLSKTIKEEDTFHIVGRGTFHVPSTKKQYINRIVQDSIAKKGRITLEMLDKKISCLSLTREIVLYIQDGLLKRLSVSNGKGSTIRAYAGGHELRAASSFPYNGYAYFVGKNDGRLYRIPLDGQLAEPLTQNRVTAYTVAPFQGKPALFFSDKNQQLFRTGLDGTAPQALNGLKASALNADDSYVYFTNALDNNKVYRMEAGSEIAVRLSETSAENIYVFDTHIAFESQSGAALIILPKEGGSEAQLKR